MPVLQSLPESAVDVIYDGTIADRNWWIVHIEPSGAVNVWNNPDVAANAYQRLLNGRLELGWRGVSGGALTFVNNIINSLDIEGLTPAATPAQVGGLESVSEIAYKVVPISE